MAEQGGDAAANTREIVHADPEQALWGFKHAPCFRESAMYSLAIASMFAGVEVYRKRPPYSVNNRFLKLSVPAAEAVFFGTLVSTALGTWGLCRHQLRERRDKMHEALKFRSVNSEHEQRVSESGSVKGIDGSGAQRPPPPGTSGASTAQTSAETKEATACASCEPTASSAGADASAVGAGAGAATNAARSWWRIW